MKLNKLHRGLSIIFSCLVFLFFSGCKKNPHEVVIYTSVDEIYSRPIFEAFEKETGIHVLAIYDIESQKTVGLANRLRAEKNRPQADLFWSGESSAIITLTSEGIVQESVAFAGRARVLLINTNLMPDRSQWPSSIFDLLSSKYPTNTIAIANPLFGTSATHAAALYAVLKADKGKSIYQDIQTRFIVLEGNGAVREQVASGKIAMGLTDTDDAFFSINNNDPVDIVFLDQKEGEIGTLVMPNTIAIVTGAPNSENAKILLEYITAPDVQISLYESGWFDILDFPVDKTIQRFEFTELKRMDVSLAEVAEWAVISAFDMESLFLK